MKVTSKSTSRRPLTLADVKPGSLVSVKGTVRIVCGGMERVFAENLKDSIMCLNPVNGMVEPFAPSVECYELLESELTYNPNIYKEFV